MAGIAARVPQGSLWALPIWLVDDNGDPIPLATPAMMDVRDQRATTGTLLARADSSPDVGEGSITEDGLDRAGLIIELDTTDMPVGPGYFDIWCRYAAAPDQPVQVATGTMTIEARVTDEITVDA